MAYEIIFTPEAREALWEKPVKPNSLGLGDKGLPLYPAAEQREVSFSSTKRQVKRDVDAESAVLPKAENLCYTGRVAEPSITKIVRPHQQKAPSQLKIAG